MKRIIVLFLLVSFALDGMEKLEPKKNNKNYIIFDLDDVLTTADEVACLKENFSQWLASLAKFFLGESLKYYTQEQSTRLMELLSFSQKHDDLKADIKPLYRGRPLPSLWCAYYLNKITAQEALDEALLTISEYASGTWEQSLFNFAVRIGFDPQREVDYLRPVKEGFELVEKCACNPNNKLFIFSNKNPETMKVLVARYPELFAPEHDKDRFKNRIVISGDAQLLKPDKAMYEKLILDYNLNPEHCYFIDSQPQYLDPAQSLGAHTFEINFENIEEDIASLEKHFLAEGIILPDTLQED